MLIDFLSTALDKAKEQEHIPRSCSPVTRLVISQENNPYMFLKILISSLRGVSQQQNLSLSLGHRCPFSVKVEGLRWVGSTRAAQSPSLGVFPQIALWSLIFVTLQLEMPVLTQQKDRPSWSVEFAVVGSSGSFTCVSHLYFIPDFVFFLLLGEVKQTCQYWSC